jgi:hypothetical protein
MVENVPFEYGVGNTEGNKSKMDKSSYQKMSNKPWHTPMDSVGPVATGPAPTMDHALNMIQQLAQPQYEGHGNVGGGMPEGENLMRRAVNFMNKKPR